MVAVADATSCRRWRQCRCLTPEDPMSVRFTPRSFTDAFTTELTKAVTAAAGKDGRLTKSEAQKLASRTDLGKVFADDAASFFESTGQKSVLVSKLIGLEHDAV